MKPKAKPFARYIQRLHRQRLDLTLANNMGLDDIILRFDKNDVWEGAKEGTPAFEGREQIRARRQRRRPPHQGRIPPQPYGL